MKMYDVYGRDPRDGDRWSHVYVIADTANEALKHARGHLTYIGREDLAGSWADIANPVIVPQHGVLCDNVYRPGY